MFVQRLCASIIVAASASQLPSSPSLRQTAVSQLVAGRASIMNELHDPSEGNLEGRSKDSSATSLPKTLMFAPTVRSSQMRQESQAATDDKNTMVPNASRRSPLVSIPGEAASTTATSSRELLASRLTEMRVGADLAEAPIVRMSTSTTGAPLNGNSVKPAKTTQLAALRFKAEAPTDFGATFRHSGTSGIFDAGMESVRRYLGGFPQTREYSFVHATIVLGFIVAFIVVRSWLARVPSSYRQSPEDPLAYLFINDQRQPPHLVKGARRGVGFQF
eukprot:TRINITY_DN2644_c0_g1_i1.p1 TRINITY_DN2644_c0_g1~~TRINITY_DN2644_c0_g1_i1.p1  ORF type:complete len:275 (-),score=35.73 TRINITY_DN2644_c0_g1_i1:178-1002(-)